MSTSSVVPGLRHAQVNGIRIAFEDTGKGEPLVLVHGSWGSRHNWDAVVVRLAEQYRVISYDRRGHSDSDPVAGQGTFAEDVADLAALVEALDAAPAWVVGNSVGAVIALRLALARPDLVRGVLVHEPPLRSLLSDGGVNGPLRVVLDLIRAGDHTSAAERFVNDVALGPGAWARLPAPMRATMVGNAATYLDEELAPDSRRVDEAALARYTGPVLISSGGQSPPIFQPVVQHLARLLPQAHCVEYAGAGHMPHVTHPEAFVNEVKSFTSRVNPSDHGSTTRNRATTRDDVGRLVVQAPDGTPIAVWVEGEGPAMVLVHGSLQDHSLSGALVAELRGGVTTYAIDRRGFGASGDAAEYAIEREFEDVAAVVDTVAARVAGPVAVWGHSYGASVAMGAATMSGNIDHLLLYEPSLGLAYPKGWIETLEKTVAEGGNEAAIVSVLKDILEFTDDQIDALRSNPEWERRVAMASTVAREARAEDGWVYRPGQFGGITAKTLLLSGSQSTPAIKQATDAAAAAIPGARIHVLDGHAHIAHRTDPAIVAAIVREFITSP
jgi:pimeloyl-ACP methyl ester carboxylesterase